MTGPRRTFTLEEANRTLPLVRRIVQDLVDTYATVQALLADLDTAMETASTPDMERIAQAIRRERARLEEYARELEPIGCELKGLDPGLVDFRAIYEGRDILLCWKLGEERIDYWHEENSGYAGRMPITPEVAAALGS
ncbi:MAG TPA: DUF2203 domain-containing protein [Longimicrobiales bacterium]|nr:DUF2203 domain-containing protein [Longimicrobiales bacterium]